MQRPFASQWSEHLVHDLRCICGFRQAPIASSRWWPPSPPNSSAKTRIPGRPGGRSGNSYVAGAGCGRISPTRATASSRCGICRRSGEYAPIGSRRASCSGRARSAHGGRRRTSASPRSRQPPAPKSAGLRLRCLRGVPTWCRDGVGGRVDAVRVRRELALLDESGEPRGHGRRHDRRIKHLGLGVEVIAYRWQSARRQRLSDRSSRR
jgi:hypothetical protein